MHTHFLMQVSNTHLVLTISGQLIQTITGGQHDATHLPNGMYILQHRMSDGSMKSEKIINNKQI